MHRFSWLVRCLAVAALLAAPPAREAAAQVPRADGPLRPGAPCCSITAIDAGAGMITIHDRVTGETYRLSVPPAQTSRLTVGQAVYGRAPDASVYINDSRGVRVAASSAGSGTTTVGKEGCGACKIRCMHMTDTLFGWRSDGHGGRIWSDAAVTWYYACSGQCSCKKQ